MFYWQIGGSRAKEAKKDQEIGFWDMIERGIKAIQKVVIMQRGVPSLVSLIRNYVVFK